MSIVPVKSIEEYKRIKENLRSRFETEKTGEQDLFIQQTKALQPLINVNEGSLKALKAIENSQNLTNRELQRKNDIQQQYMHQLAAVPSDPFMTPPGAPEPDLETDLDAQLNETDRENLQNMNFELPSVVLKNQNMYIVLDKIKTINRSVGQHIGKNSKLTEKQKEVYISWSETLVKYKKILEGLEGGNQSIRTPKKGKGFHAQRIDAIYYSSVDDLCQQLRDLVAAKNAGHTGLNNNINSILDELLKIKAIDKEKYNSLYKSIF